MKTAILGVLLAACTVGEAGGPVGPGNPDAPQQSGDDAPPPVGGPRLHVIATTQPTNAPATYAPRHVVAVWVESNGTIVKTINRQAAARVQHLVAWRTAAGTADADAVTGATIATHAAPLDITWDLKDRAGTVIADGTYTVRMEVADENATQPTENNEGTFTFTKGAAAQTQTALSNGGFTNVTLDFQPQ